MNPPMSQDMHAPESSPVDTGASAIPMRLSDLERRALGAWKDAAWPALYFRGVAEYSGIPPEKVRRVVRSLARKGLAEHVRGLFDDEGNVAGSGYALTRAGLLVLQEDQPATSSPSRSRSSSAIEAGPSIPTTR